MKVKFSTRDIFCCQIACF